jgi:hypothetical protein
MRRVLASLLTIAVTLILTGSVASAAPDNKNTAPFPVNCEGAGDILVTEMTRGNDEGGSPLVFGPDGRPFIAKNLSGTAEIAFSIESGPTINVTEEEQELDVPGKGFESRLTTCTFSESFEEEFVADEGVIDFLESKGGQQLDQYLGANVHVNGVFNGTALVLTPGR